jgi:hypothetical protein
VDHVQAGSLDPRPQSGSVISCREPHAKELRNERVQRDSLGGGSRLEPLVKFLVHAGDELFHRLDDSITNKRRYRFELEDTLELLSDPKGAPEIELARQDAAKGKGIGAEELKAGYLGKR